MKTIQNDENTTTKEEDERYISGLPLRTYKRASAYIGKPITAIQDAKDELQKLFGQLNAEISASNKEKLQLKIAYLQEQLQLMEEAKKEGSIDKVFNAHIGLINKARAIYVLSLSDVQEKKLSENLESAIVDGMLYAIKNFNAEEGVAFSTYAINSIEGFVKKTKTEYAKQSQKEPLYRYDTKFFSETINDGTDGTLLTLENLIKDQADEEQAFIKKDENDALLEHLSRAFDYFSEEEELIYKLNRFEGVSVRDILKKLDLNISFQAISQRIIKMDGALRESLIVTKQIGEDYYNKGLKVDEIIAKYNLKSKQATKRQLEKYLHIYKGAKLNTSRPVTYLKKTKEQMAFAGGNNSAQKMEARPVFSASSYNVKGQNELSEKDKLLQYLFGKNYDFSIFNKSLQSEDILSFFNSDEKVLLLYAINEPINEGISLIMNSSKGVLCNKVRRLRDGFEELVSSSKTYMNKDCTKQEEALAKIFAQTDDFDINSNYSIKQFFAYRTLIEGIKRPDSVKQQKETENARIYAQNIAIGHRLIEQLDRDGSAKTEEKKKILNLAVGLNQDRLFGFLSKLNAEIVRSREPLNHLLERLRFQGIRCSYDALKKERINAGKYLSKLLIKLNDLHSAISAGVPLQTVCNEFGLSQTEIEDYLWAYNYIYNLTNEAKIDKVKIEPFKNNIRSIEDASEKTLNFNLLAKIEEYNANYNLRQQFIMQAFGVSNKKDSAKYDIFCKVDLVSLFNNCDKKTMVKMAPYFGISNKITARVLGVPESEVDELAKCSAKIIARKILISARVVQYLDAGKTKESVADVLNLLNAESVQKAKTFYNNITLQSQREDLDKLSAKSLIVNKQSALFTEKWKTNIRVLNMLSLLPAYYNGIIIRERATAENLNEYFKNSEGVTETKNLTINAISRIIAEGGNIENREEDSIELFKKVVADVKVLEIINEVSQKSYEEVLEQANKTKKMIKYVGLYNAFIKDADKQPSIKETEEGKVLRLIYLLYGRIDKEIDFDLIYKLKDADLQDIISLLHNEDGKYLAQVFLSIENAYQGEERSSVRNFRIKKRKELRTAINAIAKNKFQSKGNEEAVQRLAKLLSKNSKLADETQSEK